MSPNHRVASVQDNPRARRALRSALAAGGWLRSRGHGSLLLALLLSCHCAGADAKIDKHPTIELVERPVDAAAAYAAEAGTDLDARGDPADGKPASARPRTTPDMLCSALQEQSAAPLEPGRVRREPGVLGRCDRTGPGAWRLMIRLAPESCFQHGTSPCVARTQMVETCLAHVDKNGETSEKCGGGLELPMALGIQPGTLSLTDLQLFDFDGDGVSEIAFCLRGTYFPNIAVSIFSEHRLSACALHRFRVSEGIESRAIEELRDVDKDGRPDILTYEPYGYEPDTNACGLKLGACQRFKGPLLMAHSVAGGEFRDRDDVAVAFARKSCPARRPRFAVTSGPPGTAFERSVLGFGCAHMWGVGQDDLLKELGKLEVFCQRPGECEETQHYYELAQSPAQLRLDQK